MFAFKVHIIYLFTYLMFYNYIINQAFSLESPQSNFFVLLECVEITSRPTKSNRNKLAKYRRLPHFQKLLSGIYVGLWLLILQTRNYTFYAFFKNCPCPFIFYLPPPNPPHIVYLPPCFTEALQGRMNDERMEFVVMEPNYVQMKHVKWHFDPNR